MLEPILGARSVLLLDGPEHLRQRAAAAAVPRRADAALRRPDARGRRATTSRRWPRGEPFALRPRMQAITLEVIMRAVFGVRTRARCSTRCAALLRTARPSTPSPVLLLVAARPAQRLRAALERSGAARRGRRAPLRGDRRAPRATPRPRRARRHPVAAAAARDEDGEPMTDPELRDELMTLLRRRPRDDRDRARVGVRAAAAQPARARPAARRDRRGDDYLDAVVKETLRAAARWCPLVGAQLQAPFEVGGWTLPRASTSRRRSSSSTAAPDVYPDPPSSAPSASSSAAPAPTRGSRSAAACAAASARASRCSR